MFFLEERWPDKGHFTNFDEAAKYIYDTILKLELEEIPLNIIRRDLILMTNEDVSKVAFPLIPRYIEIYGYDNYGNDLKGLIYWYAEIAKRQG